MTDIKFAVVGTGLMAAAMMSTFAKAGIRVTAVVSRDPERAHRFAQAFGIPFSAASVGSVVERSDVDAVYIASAPQDHASNCMVALEAGKAVLCEKPIALSEAEALQIWELSRKKKTLCMEGLWTLFLPSYIRFLELSRSGRMGRPGNLVADFGYPLGLEERQRNDGGVLLDRGIYLIALALRVFGHVERVDAHLGLSNSGIDEDAFLQLHHRDGGHSQLAASFTALSSNTATLSCSRGWIRLEAPLIGSETVSTLNTSSTQRVQNAMRPPSLRAKLLRRLRENPDLRRINRAMKKPAAKQMPFGTDQYLPEINHFVGLLRRGVNESDIVPMEFSLDIQRIIERARADHSRRSSH